MGGTLALRPLLFPPTPPPQSMESHLASPVPPHAFTLPFQKPHLIPFQGRAYEDDGSHGRNHVVRWHMLHLMRRGKGSSISLAQDENHISVPGSVALGAEHFERLPTVFVRKANVSMSWARWRKQVDNRWMERRKEDKGSD